MIPQTMKKNDLLLQDTLKIPSLPVLAWANQSMVTESKIVATSGVW